MTTGTAAYKAKMSVGGASTAFTGQATANTTGNTYQITTAARRKLDPATARVWKDGGTPIAAASIASEDLLFGTVTLTAPPGGAVTLDASYIPTTAIADVKVANLDETNESVDTTKIGADNPNGVKARTQTLIDASVDVTLLNDLTVDTDPNTGGTQSFRTIIAARTPVLLEIDPDGANAHVFRGWFVPNFGKTGFDPAQVVSSTMKFQVADQGNALAAAGAGWGAP